MSRPPLEIARTAQELFKPFEICQKEYQKAKELEQKLLNQDINIAVIGQFKRGKSTLVNAILGEEIMPVGIVPVTAVVTEIKYGPKSASIHYQNGVVKSVQFEDLHTYINEQENSGNKLGVSSVTMFTPAEFLKNGITFVDTPGVGSIHRKNTTAANAFVKESDAVIFMLSVDSPINQIEIGFLKNAREYASKFYFVVNKIDVISKEDLQIYLEYCKKQLADLMEVDEVQLFPVSSVTGEGIEELKDQITKDCQTSLKEILMQSVSKKLADLVDGALTQIKLYRNALSMTGDELEENFKKLNEFFDVINQRVDKLKEKIDAKVDELEGDLDKELSQFKNLDFNMSKDMMDATLKKYLISLNTWSFIQKNEISAFVNEVKNQISDKISELFGMDYHYDIQELDMDFQGNFENKGNGKISGDSFEEMKTNITNKFSKELENTAKDLEEHLTEDIQTICNELLTTLNAIFMYREENAIIVVERIENLNKLVRHLRSLRVKI